ncbi:MAG: sigma-70 family RNA polymerase sigma factor [Roseivirga sp.]|uniref:RNA polymerase sigma factor n=1 Tax=Roseivirga sp. TaxID=1964215 RepID=UPI001B1EA83C|nr:sigma-70 family RNA polymerase sigma factor [Roseivirga sp.]MBO6494418.1 sigma-70 family RNA polymerase sigma factor [Roseivirga sp.]
MQDQEILDLIDSGGQFKEDLAFNHLFKHVFPKIKRLIRSKGGTSDDAADVFQDALMVLFVKIRQKKFTLNGSISAFLMVVSRNLWFKLIQKKADFVMTSSIPEEYVGDEVNIKYSIGKLQALLNRLDSQCKMVIEDFYFVQMTMGELMEKYELGSEEAAKNKKYRCLKKLISLARVNGFQLTDFKDD